MSSTCNNILEFLHNAKHLSKQPLAQRVDIVLGNESCDLDSVVSALLFSYHLWSLNISAIPILNIPAADLPIKTEVVYFLQENSICLDDLVFRDSLDFDKLARDGLLSVHLVDHHILAARDAFLAPYVVQVIDHRPVAGPLAFEHATSTMLDIVGSCVTHVASKMNPELIRDELIVANLIYGTVLLDTACLSPAAQRATPADLILVAHLKALHAQQLQPECSLFESLQKAKSSVEHLTPAQLLVKDLKFSQQGVPVVGLPILVQEFLAKCSSVQATLDIFLRENQASFLLLLGQCIRDGTITRELGLYSSGPDSDEPVGKILVLLKSSVDPPLHLEPVCSEWDSLVKVFRVNNVKVSRKQVLPLVEKAMQS